MQYRNKIIALFTIVCLLVGMMVVPSAATGEVQMYSYDGVVLPALPEYDSETYEAAIFEHALAPGCYFLVLQEFDFGFRQYEEVEDGYLWDFCNDEENVPLLVYMFRRDHWDDWRSADTSPLLDLPLAPVWTNTPSRGFYDIDGNLFLTSSEPVPVISSGDDSTGDSTDAAMYSYNGTELPNIESVWTDKVTYPFANIFSVSTGYHLHLSDEPMYCVGIDAYVAAGSTYRTYIFRVLDGGDWEQINEGVADDGAHLLHEIITTTPIWANYNFMKDGTLYLPASAPVPVGGIPEPDIPDAPVGSPVMDILSTTADSSSIHTNFNVSGISSDSLYTITASCFSGEQVVGSSAVGPFSGPEFQATVSVGGLSPSTAYTVLYLLSKDGEYTGVSQTVTVTTAAASGSGSGDGTGDGTGDSGSCACPSILNFILSAITTQTNFLSTWQQTWTTRMDSFESTLSKLIPVPDPTETALKESVKDTTKEVADSLFADDAPTKVTASDVKDIAQIGEAASSMFDSGVSVGSFFDTLNDLRFIAFFSQATYDDLNTVPSVSTYSRGEQNGYVDYYSENLNKIQQFAGGG